MIDNDKSHEWLILVKIYKLQTIPLHYLDLALPLWGIAKKGGWDFR